MARTFYKGKRELTMQEFEALTELDPNIDYDITDYPQTSITNEQMTYALTCTRLFPEGTTFICADSGDYTQGHTYQIQGTTKAWVDIEPDSTTSVSHIEITSDGNVIVHYDSNKMYITSETQPITLIAQTAITDTIFCQVFQTDWVMTANYWHGTFLAFTTVADLTVGTAYTTAIVPAGVYICTGTVE